jgi:heme exporter protein C
MQAANRIVPVLLVVAVVMFFRAPWLIDAAPQEATMGLVQKIFYFHVPAAATSFMGAFICGIASAVFLWRRTPSADHVALAAAELAVVFGLIVLLTGPLWARKAWGVWWQWDARLTMTLVMWMVFVAYLLLRRFGGPGSEILAAAVGVFGTALVPFVYLSVKFWRTVHPTTDVVRTLPPEMAWPFRWSMIAFVVLFAILLMVRTRLESARAALDAQLIAVEES